MKLTEIEAGKKYYNNKAVSWKDRSTGRKGRELSVIRVLEVDSHNKRILASVNGFPAQWHDAALAKKWSLENPAKETA